ncbi:hypothetical protein J3055_001893 [Listeria monocytogenes]|nr:hypothetical protein [Listeria monocytogenes]EHG1774964.1 hypothetical protein [Listeria monocytogenes]
MVNSLVIRHYFGMDADEIDITLYNKNPAIFKIAGFLPNWRIISPPE